MLTFQEPKTGRTQQVGENERVRISTLKRLGWKQVSDAPAQDDNLVVSYSSEELDQLPDESDWEANAAMTDEEIEAAIASDPDETARTEGITGAEKLKPKSRK